MTAPYYAGSDDRETLDARSDVAPRPAMSCRDCGLRGPLRYVAVGSNHVGYCREHYEDASRRAAALAPVSHGCRVCGRQYRHADEASDCCHVTVHLCGLCCDSGDGDVPATEDRQGDKLCARHAAEHDNREPKNEADLP